MLNGQKCMLTYACHVPKAWLENEFRTKNVATLSKDIKFFRMAHETSETGYSHTHVVIDFGKQVKIQSSRRFDIKDNNGQIFHPNIEAIKTIDHWENSVRYLSKQDPENADLKDYKKSICADVQSCKSLTEAIDKHMTKFSDVSGITAVYNLKKDTLPEFDWNPTLPWQHDLGNELWNTRSDLRKIIWVYDEKGGMGKTSFCKYCWIKDPARFYISKDLGTTKDGATVVQSAIEGGWNGHAWLINLNRLSESHLRIYNYLEDIKDSWVTPVKYKGKTICWGNPPHLVIFSNWAPRTIDERGKPTLSIDRWDIREINPVTGVLERRDIWQLYREQLQDLKTGYTGVGDYQAMPVPGRSILDLYSLPPSGLEGLHPLDPSRINSPPRTPLGFQGFRPLDPTRINSPSGAPPHPFMGELTPDQ